MKPRCLMIRLKSAERVTTRKERPVLTERGWNTPSEVEVERTEETSLPTRTEVTEETTPDEPERGQGI